MALTTIDVTKGITGVTPTANGGTGAASYAPGKVLQVQSQTLNTEASSTSSSFADTGLTINITPSATSSKVLVMVGLGAIYSTSSAEMQMKLLRGSTDLGRFIINSAPGVVACGTAINQLDTPNSTSAQTYKVQFMRNTGSGTVFVCINDSTATITAMEIGA